jgi:hypothetical protein
MADNILQEQTWFTATTLGVNALLMSETAQTKHLLAARLASTVLSAFAAYLILERSAGATGKVDLPEDLKKIPANQKTPWHKVRETAARLKVMPAHLLFVVCEFSGSFFYLLLVLGSCAAVWLSAR